MPLSSAGIHGSAEEQGKRCRQLVRNQIPRLIIKGIMLNLVIAPLVHHNFTPVFNPARIVFFISNCKHERILGLPSFNHSQYFEAERGNYRVIETFRWEQKTQPRRLRSCILFGPSPSHCRKLNSACTTSSPLQFAPNHSRQPFLARFAAS